MTTQQAPAEPTTAIRDVKMIIGGEQVGRRRADVRRDQPGHRRDHRARAAGRPGGRGPRRGGGPQAFDGPKAGRAGRPRSAAARCRSSPPREANLEELAQIESRNVGKPISAPGARRSRSSLVFEYYAGAANKHFGETIPISMPGLDFTLREPIGVVGLIVPWNFPLNMAALEARAGAGRRQHLRPQAAPATPR